MLDNLLGKTQLKERIQELGEEVDSLEERLESAERKRKNAVTEKQDADRRVNELETKVEELQDKLEREKEDEEAKLDFRLAEAVRGRHLESVLSVLRTAEARGEDLTTVRVAPGDRHPNEFEPETDALFRDIESKTGVVCFGDEAAVLRVALAPPVRIKETEVSHGPTFDPPEDAFDLGGTHAVAVVRSDEYAGGVYADGDRVALSSKSTDIKSKHSKGGFSQGSFERARDEEVKKHVRDSADEFESVVARHEVDRAFVAGESRIADTFADELSMRVPVSTRSTDARGSGEELLRRGYRTVESARLYVV